MRLFYKLYSGARHETGVVAYFGILKQCNKNTKTLLKNFTFWGELYLITTFPFR